MQRAGLRPVVKSWFLLTLLATAATPAQGQPKPGAAPAVTARSLPATSGVRSEAQTVLAAPAEEVATMRRRVAENLRTIFASHYTRRITLQEALQPEIILAYSRRATGEKYLITPAAS